MIGLMILGALLIYGLILLSATAWMYRTVKKSGSSTARSTLAAAFVALLILAPVFWDAIPTYIAFKYYSQKEAGLKVFKTLEQWKAENPGVAETLVAYEKLPRQQRKESEILTNGKSRWYLNERFATDTYTTHYFLSVRARTYDLIDLKNSTVLSQYVEVISGNSGGVASGGPGWWKFWLVHERTDWKSVEDSWRKFRNAFENIGSK
jgi:hypothetical protein